MNSTVTRLASKQMQMYSQTNNEADYRFGSIINNDLLHQMHVCRTDYKSSTLYFAMLFSCQLVSAKEWEPKSGCF
jgi:hypothetical protein